MLLGQVVGRAAGDAVLLLVGIAPLHPLGRDARSVAPASCRTTAPRPGRPAASGCRGRRRRARGLRCSARRWRRCRLRWMKRTRSFSLSSSSTTEACEMPIEASCVSDFTISGNCRRFGRWIARPTRNTANSGTGMPVVGQQLLRQRLVARQHQPARIAAGVGQPQQLEMADDVLIEDRDVVEALEQVEGDVRLPARSPLR